MRLLAWVWSFWIIGFLGILLLYGGSILAFTLWHADTDIKWRAEKVNELNSLYKNKGLVFVYQESELNKVPMLEIIIDDNFVPGAENDKRYVLPGVPLSATTFKYDGDMKSQPFMKE